MGYVWLKLEKKLRSFNTTAKEATCHLMKNEIEYKHCIVYNTVFLQAAVYKYKQTFNIIYQR